MPRPQLTNIPTKPGIYQFYDEQNNLLYVGKAKQLKNRVSSYFRTSSDLLPKTRLMVSQITKIKTIVVESEFEALLLEAELIKKLHPKYNHLLKDDKSYIYILFTKDDFPRIISARKNQIKTKGLFFGPFPNTYIVKTTLRELRKIFPYRSCSTARFNKKKVCLYYHLQLCQGPCENKISKTAYQKELQGIKLLLQRKRKTLIIDLTKKMKQAAEKEKFETAAVLRDKLQKLEYLQTSFRNPTEYMIDPNLLEDIRTQTLTNLQKILGIASLPQRIECYDISNIQGKQAVGSMVVFTQGESDKKEYRRFRIKYKDTPDDYFMLQEVLRRRLKKTGYTDIKVQENTKKRWPLPDLIVIDGGKGQLSAALEVVENHQEEIIRKIPVISLAKKQEEIFKKDYVDDIQKIILSKRSKELQLLQQLRDEAHRFAITYHRKLRSKNVTA